MSVQCCPYTSQRDMLNYFQRSTRICLLVVQKLAVTEDLVRFRSFCVVVSMFFSLSSFSQADLKVFAR